MGRRVRGRRAATTATLLAVTVTAALAAGCTSGSGTPDDGRGSSSASERGTSPSGAGPSPLAVKLDNAGSARPHTGVGAADVVYVEQVEGGLSRLMAVYATRVPETVGPVRSARESDLELLRQFHRPTLVFSGAQKKLLPLIDEAPLRPVTPSDAPDAFYRGSDRAAPHNLYLRPGRIAPEAPGRAALTTGFRYGPAPAGGTATASRTVRYPAARFTFTWSDARDRWLVGMDGAPATEADGARMAAATVVVQYVRIRESGFRDFLGNNSPYTETVGSGRATVLRDGRAWDVDWKRPKATDGTAFTTGDGSPVNFARGQVWVVYAKAS
ncbi:DUF3048 domain-containing protein [Streptomyces dubilierae]|uniref:DUF3048 domain-containing protein n=1 Tax=Streptomyces dubilierae TaxID=3075533 RepID=A0ABU2P7N5_9ACTN|nr:DUF3048 domain-containing protein [Streptomyces sp. DSM 41921]MDT0388152.1 DUF3048 domain-containing protein [Streptomyces sp. DSM 41921]